MTLLDGSNFVLSGHDGDIRPSTPQGLMVLDSRFLSRFELFIDDHGVEALGVSVDTPRSATFFGQVGRTLAVFRRRTVDAGITEQVELRNYGQAERTVTITVFVESDFADLFDVKNSRVEARGWRGAEITDHQLHLGFRRNGVSREARITFADGADVHGAGATWTVVLPPAGRWATTVRVEAVVDDAPVPRDPESSYESWEQSVPRVHADDASLVRAVRQSARDLGSLRIFDPNHPDQAIVAAGAPWFMSPFGRDAILTAWMALAVDPTLARGVLQTLARLQATAEDPATDAQPGKILHEVRFGAAASAMLSGGHIYYGSVDATPLFVMLLGEVHRWGSATDLVETLIPHADRALQWLVAQSERGPNGFVYYQRSSPFGLANQGWKDSGDGIRYGDGRIADAPIALCEVQGYTYAAYLARAHFAREAGDTSLSDHWAARASVLREAFNRDFWLADRGCFAVGLDIDGRAIDSMASNQGHCLWTGIVDEDKAAAVADVLLSPQMFSGWGVRTLAATEPAYNPLSYHCGSVWPHDNALIAAGLVRYGFTDHAHRIIRGILDAADATAGQLPELFSGVDRGELAVPAAYPTSCVPQAWAAATPLMFLRLLLRLDPWLPENRLCLAPALPTWLGTLHVDGIPLGQHRMTVTIDQNTTTVTGLPDDCLLERRPRSPTTTLSR